MVRLIELKEGEKGYIKKINGTNRLKTKLFEMGFIEGKEIAVVKFAPLKEPIEYLIMGSRVCLRKKEAQNIWVEKLN